MTCTDRVFGTHNGEGVVDAVPDHGDPAPGALQLGDLGGLVAGKDLRDHGVDAQLPGDARRGGPVVAGEHDHLDAEVVQRDDRGRRGVAGGVGDADDRGGLAVDGGDDGGAAAGGQLVTARRELAQV